LLVIASGDDGAWLLHQIHIASIPKEGGFPGHLEHVEFYYCDWSIAPEIDGQLGHYCRTGCGFAAVSSDNNTSLTSAQMELLLWHWKLGILMQRVKELMQVVEVKEPNGVISTMDQLIAPKIKSAANCSIPLCQSCQLS
jgi:hypothetical protein